MRNNFQTPLSPTVWRRHPSLHLLPGQLSGLGTSPALSTPQLQLGEAPSPQHGCWQQAGSGGHNETPKRTRRARRPRLDDGPGSAAPLGRNLHCPDLFHLRWESTLFSTAAGSGKAVRGQTSRQKKKEKAASTCVPAPVSARPLGASTRSSANGTRLGHFLFNKFHHDFFFKCLLEGDSGRDTTRRGRLCDKPTHDPPRAKLHTPGGGRAREGLTEGQVGDPPRFRQGRGGEVTSRAPQRPPVR